MITTLLDFRRKISEIYSKYEIYIRFCAKFLLSFCVLHLINLQIGAFDVLRSVYTVVIAALVCALLPYWALQTMSCIFLVTHMCVLSLEAGLVTGMILAILLLLHCAFGQKHSVMMPVSFLTGLLNVSGMVAIPAGLLFEPAAVIPCITGIAAYNAIVTLRQNYTVLNAASHSLTNIEKITYYLQAYLKNEKVMLLMMAMLVTVLLVYWIRRLAYSYAWAIAIAAGTACYVLITMIGNVLFDIPVNLLYLGAAVAGAIVLSCILHAFCFLLDGNHTEYLQYEDEEYVYFVKAIPKYSLSGSQKRVTRITDKNDSDNAEEGMGFEP